MDDNKNKDEEKKIRASDGNPYPFMCLASPTYRSAERAASNQRNHSDSLTAREPKREREIYVLYCCCCHCDVIVFVFVFFCQLFDRLCLKGFQINIWTFKWKMWLRKLAGMTRSKLFIFPVFSLFLRLLRLLYRKNENASNFDQIKPITLTNIICDGWCRTGRTSKPTENKLIFFLSWLFCLKAFRVFPMRMTCNTATPRRQRQWHIHTHARKIRKSDDVIMCPKSTVHYVCQSEFSDNDRKGGWRVITDNSHWTLSFDWYRWLALCVTVDNLSALQQNCKANSINYH